MSGETEDTAPRDRGPRACMGNSCIHACFHARCPYTARALQAAAFVAASLAEAGVGALMCCICLLLLLLEAAFCCIYLHHC